MSRYSKNKMSNLVTGPALSRSARTMLITSLVALFMMMIGTLPALAGESKIYPGSMGVRYAGTSTPTYNCSAIGNPSTSSWLYLDLPAIRGPWSKTKQSYVSVIDRHPSANIRCRLCSVYQWDCKKYVWCSQTRYSSGSGCHEQMLDTGGVKVAFSSHLYFSCRIPPRYNNNTSYIISYYVRED